MPKRIQLKNAYESYTTDSQEWSGIFKYIENIILLTPTNQHGNLGDQKLQVIWIEVMVNLKCSEMWWEQAHVYQNEMYLQIFTIKMQSRRYENTALPFEI